MNEAPATPDRGLRTPGSLQAILQRADGTMETIAVPLPLPEAIVRVDAGGGPAERWFTRERSPDSVLRFVEHDSPRVLDAPRRCAQCAGRQLEYLMQKPAPGSSDGAVLCVDCYTKAATT
jgi:hypothetical protein